MLVGYSSSSEEEEEEEEDSEAGGEAPAATNQSETTCRKYQEEDDGFPARKRPKTEEEAPKSRCVSWSCNRLLAVSAGDTANLRERKSQYRRQVINEL